MYVTAGVDDAIITPIVSVELQTRKSASQQSESSASVPAEANNYESVSPVHLSHPSEVIKKKKKVVEMITKTTTGYVYLYIFIHTGI